MPAPSRFPVACGTGYRPRVDCPTCERPAELCICAFVQPIDNRVEVVILQHPQEQDKLLGTARLTVQHLARASFRVGLSWPGLEAAVGRPVDARRWGVLHLGSAAVEAFAPGQDLAVLDR